jgi:hypothetical protein
MSNIPKIDTDLDVKVIGNVLTIKIGAKKLALAMEANPKLYNPDTGEALYRVTNPKAFAEEVCAALLDEEEDGTTLVHKMLDEAMNNAVEAGSENVEEKE